MLHEIGQVISVESLEKHTLYMMLNTPFSGLTQRERVIAAYLAASHDEIYLPDLDDFISRGPLQPEDRAIIVKLIPILQIIHSLDRSHWCGNISDPAQRRSLRDLVISKANADLEIKDARRAPVQAHLWQELRKPGDMQEILGARFLLSVYYAAPVP